MLCKLHPLLFLLFRLAGRHVESLFPCWGLNLPSLHGGRVDHWAPGKSLVLFHWLFQQHLRAVKWTQVCSVFPLLLPCSASSPVLFLVQPFDSLSLFGFSTYVSIFQLPLADISVGTEAQNDWLVLNVFSSSHTGCWHCLSLRVCVFLLNKSSKFLVIHISEETGSARCWISPEAIAHWSVLSVFSVWFVSAELWQIKSLILGK